MPLTTEDAAGIALLRARLVAANFTPRGVREALGVEGETLSRPAEVPVHLRRLTDASAIATAIKLFVLGVPVRVDEAASAFAPLTIARLRVMGILSVGDAGAPVHAAVRIVPHDDDLLIASDRAPDAGQPTPDHVPGVQRPSLTLAHLTVRRPAASGLDMGTGCGIQAILLARHCERVVATDISSRALEYAAFNALLNGARNVEFRLGSWFEPVAAERFDVVVSNPPYVISPEARYLFRDGGLTGDAVSERVVRQLPTVLAPGGFGTVMVSWIHRREEEPTAPLRRWVEGSGCDAWLLHYATETPLTTAARWNEPEAGEPARYAELLDRWLDYYRHLGVEAIAYGAVILRSRSHARSWVRADPLPAGTRLRPASDHIERVFAAHDRLSELREPADLLDERFALAPSHRVTEVLRYQDGASQVERVTLLLEEGLGFQASVDTSTAALLPRLDGRRTLREALGDVFAGQGRLESEREDFIQAGVGVVRRLFELGFVVRSNNAV